ncbi:MAG TPA: MOSC domain-containing protein [Bryobacteraceae bacterium]|nr:MOSC domain-containing protein [Bryobacteraceae bacterium]
MDRQECLSYFLTGTVIQISISRGGLPKRAVSEAFLTPLGLAGDAHAHPAVHGGPEKAVLIMTAESIDELAARGFPVFYGAMGENLTTRGLDRRMLRSGQRFRAGAAVIELTRVRTPCASQDIYGPSIKGEVYDAQVKSGDITSPRWAVSGFYAAVVRPGLIRVNDEIALESEPA